MHVYADADLKNLNEHQRALFYSALCGLLLLYISWCKTSLVELESHDWTSGLPGGCIEPQCEILFFREMFRGSICTEWREMGELKTVGLLQTAR